MWMGKGTIDCILTENEVDRLCDEFFNQVHVDGKRLLIIIPDNSRTAPIGLMFRVLYGILAKRAAALDFIVALGTHPPLTDDAINQRIEISQEDRQTLYPKARFFNHEWKNPEYLQSVGVIPESEIAELSDGLMKQSVEVTINKMVYDHDLALIVGPVFPHEVVGFSGGNKYLFPGIAGKEIIDFFHWLGALITSYKIIGNKYTPVRCVIDRAAAMLPIERLACNLVVKGDDLAGLYLGTPEEAWKQAANLSEQLHIVYKSHPFKKVLSCAPRMYEDLWTGGKCMYKLEPVVADGGELIIYAPHIREISVTHGDIIRKIGYHVRDYFTKQPERFRDIPGCIKAHSTHVKGLGAFQNGVEKPRINVVLATSIPEDVCREINLGYCDPETIRFEEWQNREDEGILFVPKAGEMLYRMKN